MNANALNFDLFALSEPKSRADLIALAQECRQELARISAVFESVLEKCDCASEA